ncbi:MAG: DUF5752 family protein [Pirellulales bacterium]|nr:DUF5752 family protein [Pirellulales bacterium]
MDVEPFVLVDCSLARRAIGRSCSNLRELLDAVRTVPDPVLEHHMLRCPLEDHFEMYEFPNDLARWCWEALGDPVLAEELGLVDPYKETSIAGLRSTLIDTIEDRLWGQDRIPWCRSGFELHLVASRLVAYDTGERIPTPAALVETVERMSLRSLFFHVHEARRRTGGQTDDFSLWLEQFDTCKEPVTGLREIDFYFLNLSQLHKEILELFQQHSFVPTVT